MKSVLASVCIAILVVANTACATEGGLEKSRVENLEGGEQEQTIRCEKLWAEIMAEWRKSGGGFQSSLRETRKQIESDKTSRFSRYVRAAWAAQASYEDYDPKKRWPLENEERYLVSDAFSRANSGRFPESCSVIMFDAVLWEELHVARPAGGIYIDFGVSKILKFSDAPDSFVWDSPDAQSWTEFWLLRRLSPSGN